MTAKGAGNGAVMHASSQPYPLAQPCEQDVQQLGEALKARADEVLAETIVKTSSSGEVVDAPVQKRFEQICVSSTTAVARWIAGEDIQVTNDAAKETSQIFGELAARRAASLNEVTRRSLWWRNVMADVLRASAVELGSPPEALTQALNMLQLSLSLIHI